MNKQVCSMSLFIGFSSREGNISCIWKSVWIIQYITLFFIEVLNSFPSVLIFWKGLYWSITTLLRKDTLKWKFYGCHFILKRTRLPLIDSWKGSEIGILHFTSTVIVCLATGPGDLKLITDSLPLFGLNKTFRIAKADAPMMWGDAMPHEMYEFTKSFSCTPLKTLPTLK